MSFLNLKALLSLNASGFHLGLKQAESGSKKLAREIKSEFAKAFGTAALIAWTAKIIDSVENIADLSEKLGVSTDALQEWGYAAKKNGADLNSVAKFFEALGSARDEAIGGNERAILSFQRLGVSLDDLRNKRIEDIGKIIGGTVQTGDIQKLIGALKTVGADGGMALAAAFKAGLDQMVQDARDAGTIIAKETLDNVKELRGQLEEFKDQMAGPTAKALSFVNWLIPGYKLLAGISKDLSQNFFTNDKMKGPRLAGQRIEEFFNQRALDKIFGKSTPPPQIKSSPAQPPTDKISYIFNEAMKAAPVRAISERGSSSNIDNLTPWQKAGAAVRQNPYMGSVPPVFGDIARSTAITNEKLTQIRDVLAKGNFTAGYEASQRIRILIYD